jgi:Domain of unknown function (DUF4376)
MFNAKDWYWSIAGDAANVYASARNIYVPTSDGAYTSWKAMWGTPPNVPSESDIWYYVQAFQPWWLWDATTGKVSQPAAGQYYKGQLRNYNSDKRDREVQGGMTAAGIPVKTDNLSRGEINQSVVQATGNANFSAQWYGSDGKFYPVDQATMLSMGEAVSKHTNDCFTVFQQVDNNITLNTVTTLAQIDTAYVGL